METQRADKIATFNDKFRKWSFSYTLTRGVLALEDVDGVIGAVRKFKHFDGDNDPYGEHDFGSFEWAGETIFWKIDYYDETLRHWCDPLNPECKRVLTVMLSSEY